MNNLNVISFIEKNDLVNEDLTGHIVDMVANVAPDLKKIYADDFLRNPVIKLYGVNLFIFDRASIDNSQIHTSVDTFLRDNPKLINLCVITSTVDLTLEPNFFSAFHDFLLWPCSRQEIQTRLYRFLLPRPEKLVAENKLLSEFSHLHLTGKSPIFIKTISLIKKMAGCHAPVLIQGETGTGKENAARAIHYLSDRRDYAFIPINCAAIPDELIESELFGHEKGAFTDAKSTQLGLVSLAQGGTLFLDEVDSLTPKAQATLLRFLQTQEYRPLGSKTTLQADVRLLAATNADLKNLSQQKLFREDLYFRLNVLNLHMPSLRHRVSDIPLIADALIEKFSQQHKIPAKKIHSSAIHYLLQQSWPGNIRELENLLLRSFLLSAGNMLMIENQYETEDMCDDDIFNEDAVFKIPESSNDKKNPTLSFQDAKARAITLFEKNYLEEIMALTDGNVSAAARLAGKERRALGKLLQKYRIQKAAFQSVRSLA